jgi:hypothetical protein
MLAITLNECQLEFLEIITLKNVGQHYRRCQQSPVYPCKDSEFNDPEIGRTVITAFKEGSQFGAIIPRTIYINALTYRRYYAGITMVSEC